MQQSKVNSYYANLGKQPHVIFALIGLTVNVGSARTPTDWANNKPIVSFHCCNHARGQFQTNKQLKDVLARVPRLGSAFTSTCLKELRETKEQLKQTPNLSTRMNVVVENATESFSVATLDVENDQVKTAKFPKKLEIEDSKVD
ncbi:hypothetical protein OUZ56_015461 [Daphnia magna]|uniref:Uncharacterized protein n=1 Tax=Daphnia magna TaxID=35525 RepID=A0ABR0AMZ2_9CRUS|nr:hypothetical protein OUZ56_015461 [Daphnia magna]